MAAYAIEIVDRFGKNYLVPLNRFPFTIGRGRENDLTFPHTSVSRKHALIEKSSAGLTIIDNSSRNHVFVNQKQVGKGRLRKGDLLRVGVFNMRLIGTPVVSMSVPSHQLETLYFPPQEDWDPLQPLADGAPGEIAPRTTRAPDWKRLLRVSLEENPTDVNETILDLIEESTDFDRCFLIVFEQGSPEKIEVLAQRFKSPPHPSSENEDGPEIFVSEEILRRVVASCEAVMVSHDQQNLRLNDSFIRTGAQTALCVPLVVRKAVVGVAYLDRLSDTQGFSEDDVEILGPLAGLLALKVENRQLQEAELAAQLQCKELEIAEKVHRSLYRPEPIHFPGHSVEGFTRSCYQVGGDVFDFLLEGASALTWMIGDVSGKGLSSALYTVGIVATLKAHLRDQLPLHVLMQRLDYYVRDTFRPDHFLTLFLAKLDAESGVLNYCNAGHLHPIVLKENGEMVELDSAEPALNISSWRSAPREFQLARGDLLVAYTDGVIEARGEDGQEFGKERMEEFIRTHREEPLVSIRKKLFSEVAAFSAGEVLRDDVSLVLLRKEKERGEV
jgi:sigma-B regulation protein RsbU (phosphoserine phosphatase)